MNANDHEMTPDEYQAAYRKWILILCLVACIIGLPVGIQLGLPFVWGLAIIGIPVCIIKLLRK